VDVYADNRTMVVRGATMGFIRELSRRTSYLVEGHEHVPAFKKRRWDGRERLVKAIPRGKGGGYRVPIGLHVDLVALAKERNEKIKWHDQRRELHPPIVTDWNPDWTLRPYQGEAVDAIFTDRGMATAKCLVRLATRGGKTVIAAGAIDRVKLRTLFLVTSDLLLNQTRKVFAATLRVPIGRIGDGKWEEQDITVASVQTLARNMEPLQPRIRRAKRRCRQAVTSIPPLADEEELDKLIAKAKRSLASCLYKPAKWTKIHDNGVWKVDAKVKIEADAPRIERERIKLARTQALFIGYDLVFFDEVHHLEGERWRDVLAALDAWGKVGLSATIWTEAESGGFPTGSIWVRATTGPIVYDLDVNRLIRMGYLVRPSVQLIKVPKTPRVEGVWVEARTNGLIKHRWRNHRLVAEVRRLVSEGLRTLVVVQELEHVRILQELMAEAGLAVEKVVGATSTKQRELAIARFVAGESTVIIGTVFGEGVDIPAIQAVVNAEGGASRKACLQRNRQLTPIPGVPIEDQSAVLVDFMDLHNDYLARHSLTRIRLYREQGAFDIQVIA
jgi:superfamily II DNA or RNA helicase